MDIQISIFISNQLRATRSVPIPCVIGRSRQATLTIGHAVVSRKHCELYLENDRLNLRDSGSLNGTFFRGDMISGNVILQPGDSFRIGELTFVVNFQQPKPHNLEAGSPPLSAPALSALDNSDAFSALAPPSSMDIIDLAMIPESVDRSYEKTGAVNPSVMTSQNVKTTPESQQ